MFDLLRYFSLSSAVVIAVLGGCVGNMLRWYETARLVSEAEQRNQATAAQVMAIAWDPHARFLASTTERDPDRLKASGVFRDIDQSVRQASARLPVYKVTIFKPDGLTLYSSDPSEVGTPVDIERRGLADALSGKPSSSLKDVPSVLGMTGWLHDIESVETYLPKFGARGEVIGIVRVDTDVTADSVTMNAMIRSTVLLSIGVCFLLYISLYAIVARADRLMKSQYEALQSFNDRLEAEVSQRTAHMLHQQSRLGELMRSTRFQNASRDEAFAALSEAGADILDVDRCGIYVPVANAGAFAVINVYDKPTNSHTGRFSRPSSFFMSDVHSMQDGHVTCMSDIEAAPDAQADFVDYYKRLGIRAALDVPIFIDGSQAGVLCFRKSGEPHEWRPNEKLAAGALATLAALVLQRTEREKAEATIVAGTQHLARQQAVLTDMARDVAMQCDSLELVLRPMLRSFTEICGGNRGGIWILAEDRQSFAYAETFSAVSNEIEPASASDPFNLAALELHQDAGGPASLPDVREHHTLARFHSAGLLDGSTIALLRAPISIDGVLVGFVSCEAAQPTQWTAEQSLFVTGFANIAALAIERHQRRRAESRVRADAETLSRQQNVLNALLHSEGFRNGSLAAAMRQLSRTLANEADIDRVAIVIRSMDGKRLDYAEAYQSAQDIFVPMSEEAGFRPQRLLAAARASLMIIANDVTTHPVARAQNLDAELRAPGMRSLMQLPIEVGGQVVGVIHAAVCGEPIVWSTKQKLFATAIGNLAALTIERSHRQSFERAIAASAARFEMQQVAITEFMSDESWRRGGLTEAARKLSEMASATLGIERISVWTMAPDCGAMSALDVYDQRTNEHSEGAIRTEADHPRFFSSVLVDGVVSSDDVATDPRLASLQDSYFALFGVKALLAMPILMDGAPVGVVCAEKCGQPITWSEEHRLFLSALTSLVALVVERKDRKRAEDEISAAAKRMAHMLETFSSLMKSDVVRHGSLRDTLRELTRSFCEEVEADRTAVLLVESRSNDVVLAEAYVRDHGRHETPLYPPGRSWPEIRSQIDIASNLAIEDVAQHRNFTANENDLVQTQHLGSLLQMPIIIDGNVTGAIRASTIGRKVKWTSEARLFAAAIAQLASLAVEHNTRTRVERDLRDANIAAEQANRAKSQFLANMSHEIRTPMNGVFGMTEILIKSPLSDRQRRQVRTIHESAKTLLTIVNDILDLSRIEDGKLTIDAQAFDLHQCIESAAELFLDDAQGKGLALHVAIAPETPRHIVGDTGRLRQVCVNLISNAIKFTEGGRVEVRVSGSSGADGLARIAIDVCDTGIGIEQAMLGRLFQPFTQADNSLSRRFGGTGLGLSISRHLVSLMGGSLTLDSHPGRGTRVSITLECPLVATPSPVSAKLCSLSGRRILLVDRNHASREVVLDYLAGAGAQPVTAQTAEIALEFLDAAAAAGAPFEAVVIDMTGLDMSSDDFDFAAAHLPGVPPTGIVVLTSPDDDVGVQRARDPGNQRRLTKPARRADLLDAVAQAIVEPRAANTPALERRRDRTSELNARVLVAEDNPVNEEVVREMLTGLGCTMVAARDGRAACAAFEAETFDLVLMDCQMPEMDGLTATREIRGLEKRLGKSPTPVVAVTAHAFDADRAACHDAGMNDYLMKPFSEGELAAMLTRWIAPAQRAAVAPAHAPATESTPALQHVPARKPTTDAGEPIDVPLLTDLRQHRPQFFERLVSAYLSHAPGAVAKLLDALAERQADALYQAAHSLKSSSANVGARRVAELARQIEMEARNGCIDGIAPVVVELQHAFATVQATITRVLGDGDPGTMDIGVKKTGT